MDFSNALYGLKNGHRIFRRGWNGKDMWVYIVPERQKPLVVPSGAICINPEHPEGLTTFSAYIAMKTAQDNVVPWLASQTDILADDWEVL